MCGRHGHSHPLLEERCVRDDPHGARRVLVLPSMGLVGVERPTAGARNSVRVVCQPLMLAAPSIAIDLPLKILIWEDRQGKVALLTSSLQP